MGSQNPRVFKKTFDSDNREESRRCSETAENVAKSADEYWNEGPNQEVITEDINRFVGPRVNESDYFPRTNPRGILQEAVAPPVSAAVVPVNIKSTAMQLSERTLRLRKKNVLLNRFLGPIEENNNDEVMKIQEQVDKKLDETVAEQIFINKTEDTPEPLIEPFATKNKITKFDGGAIVDLDAVVEKLKQNGYTAPAQNTSDCSTTSSGSSGTSSKRKVVSPLKGKVVNTGRIDDEEFRRRVLSRRREVPPPPVFTSVNPADRPVHDSTSFTIVRAEFPTLC